MTARTLALLAFLALPGAAEPSRAAQEEARRIAFSLEIAAAEYQKAVTAPVLDKVEQQEAVDFLVQARARFKRLAASEGLDDFNAEPVDAQLAALEAEARAGKGDPGAFRGRAARASADVASAFGATAAIVPPGQVSKKAGAEVYRMHCAMCHGAKGDGRGPAYPGLNPKPARFDDAAAMARIPPAELFRVVAVGVDGTSMTAFDDRLTERQRWEAVYHLYSFTGHANAEAAAAVQGTDPGMGPGGPSDGPGLGPAVAAVKAELARVVSLAASGDAAGATDAAADAYLRFEPVEPAFRALDLDETAALEAAFGDFRNAARSGAPDVAARAADIARRLEALAAPREARGALGTFAQSFLIIAREGFEAMLVLGAIAALLARTGSKKLLSVFYAGAWAGVGASLATAWALEAVFQATAVQQEALEGLVLVVAAGTLVYVAYWMVDAAAMGDWNRWLRERLGKATERGGGTWTLASVSFLAVYREGFETVLFYKALWAMDTSQTPALTAGFAAGGAALGALYLLMSRGALRLPMRPFFLGTGALLYWLAFTFAGRAPTVLQAAGWLGETPTPWSVSLPWAGVNPTWESATPQFLLAFLAVLGLRALRARSRRAGGRRADPAHATA